MSDATGTPAGTSAIDVSKVIRLWNLLRTLRTEVRDLVADESSLQRLAAVHNQIETHVAQAIPVDLAAELAEFSSCCRDNPSPSKAEIRVAEAQLIGWIEGLLQGVQLTVAAAGGELPEAGGGEETTGVPPGSYL